MPMNNQMLGGLQSALGRPVPGSQFTADPGDDTDIALYQLQQQRARELASNLAKAQGPGGFSTGGTVADLLGLHQDLAQSPITKQASDIADTEAANKAAVQQGFGGGGTSPSQLQALYHRKQAEQAAALEREKVQMPLTIEQMKEKAATGRQQQLTDFFKSGQVEPGTELDMGGGMRVKKAPITQLPAGQATVLQKKIDDLSAQRAALDTPGATERAQDFAAKMGLPGFHSIEARKTVYDQQIADLKKQLIPAGAQRPGQAVQPPAPAPDAALRVRAQAALKAHGLDEKNESFIQEAMRQLSTAK